MLLGPAHGDGSAPVVGHGDDRSLDLQCVGDRAKICNMVGKASGLAGPFREPHIQRVDGNHSPPGQTFRQAPPHIGPIRVSVDTEHRPPHGIIAVIWTSSETGIKHMPGPFDPVYVDGGDQTRPSRVQSGQVRRWQVCCCASGVHSERRIVPVCPRTLPSSGSRR